MVKYFRRFILIAPLILQFLSLPAQAPQKRSEGRGCYTPAPPAEWENWFSKLALDYQQQQFSAQAEANIYKLPVIVHVIHGGEPVGVYPNISKQQVESQMAVLNADFSGIGHGITNVPQPFVGDIANCDIVFKMAQLDPNGKPLTEPGIHRVDWHDLGPDANPESPISSPGFQTSFDKYVKPLTIWDPERYFNIWVSTVKNTLDLLGYATFPGSSGLDGVSGGGTFNNDGVWIWAGSFGTVGTQAPYHMGRTATHEIGHWLGLRHIWGDESCGNDYCDDTPPQLGYNLGCKMVFPKISCSNQPNGEMFMNFMDYGDDPCISMFTWDQRTRMHVAMQNAVFRKNLTASSATLCDLPPTEPVASFSVPPSACTNTFITLRNLSSGIPGPNSSWHVDPAEGTRLAFDEQTGDLIMVLEVPGNYSVSLTASNSKGNHTSAQVLVLEDCGILPGMAEQKGQGPISLFPNPASDVVTFSAGNDACISVDIFNSVGQNVLNNKGCGRVEMDLRHQPGGIYFAVISQGSARQVRKLVISR